MKRSLLELVLRRVTPLAADGRVADADLLRRFAADRDEAAFATLVRRHGPLVWAVCRQLLPNEPDAEDAFQATFLTLVRSAGTVRTPAALGAWLHSVACRVALNAKRTAGRRRKREQAAAAVEAVAPVAQSTWGQLQVAVHEEVRRLPEPLRTAFVLCELEGRSQPDVAGALGWKLGTLSGRLTRARQQLLDRLAKRGIPAAAVVAGAAAGGAAVTAAPAVLTIKTAALARAGFDLTGVVSQTVLEFARGATEVSMTRTKLIAAALALAAAVACGTATTLIPLATAQPPAPAGDEQPKFPAQGNYPGATPAAAQPPVLPPRAMGGGGSGSTAGAWEYKFMPRKGDSLEAFQRLLTEQSAAGWEYCGTELLTVTDPAQKAQWGNSATVVFKRPRVDGRSAARLTPNANVPYGTQLKFPTGGTAGVTPAPAGNVPAGATPPPLPKAARPPASPNDPFGGPAAGTAPAHKTTVIPLAYAKAETLHKALSELFASRNCGISIDPRTNTLVILADEATTRSIQNVVRELDVRTPGGPREK